MNGLHIKPRWQPAIPAERRSFTAFFQPVFPQLALFHWIYPDTIPFGGLDDEFEVLAETTCSEGYIPPDTILPRFAHFIEEDGTDLFGFRTAPDVTVIRRRLRESPADYEWISQHTDICFFSVDGAWWEVYSRDRALLETVRQHLAGISDITVRDTILIQRDDLLRPKFWPKFLR
jgi:hypothetical protein